MLVFISYRRGDARHVAGRLKDHVGWEREIDGVFLDTQSIRPGEPFPDRIRDAVQHADCILVVVGPLWDGGTIGGAPARIFDPGDFVRLEVALALAAPGDVIPILVDGAAMPRPEQMPEELQPLLQRNAYAITNDKSFSDEIRPLLRHILGHEPQGGDTPLSIVTKAGIGATLGLITFLLFSALVQFVLGLDAQTVFSFADREAARALWELLPPVFMAAGAIALPLLRRRWRISMAPRR